MAKWAIVYDSKYGTTEKYAKWIQAKVGNADLYKAKGLQPETIIGYELLLFIGGIYNDKMPICDFIKKNIGHLMFKKVAIVGNGWYEDKEINREWIMDKNFSTEMHSRFPLFLVRGEINNNKISIPERMQLMGIKAQIKRRQDRTNDDIVALSMIDGMNSYTAEDNLKELYEFIDSGKWVIKR